MKLTSIVFTIIFLLLPSPVFRALLPLSETNFTILFSLILLIILLNNTSLYTLKVNLLILIFLLIGAFASLLSNSLSQFNLLIFFGFSIFLSLNLTKIINLNQLVKISNGSCYLMIILTWLGFLFTLYNPEPITCITNPDGRFNCLYFTTFSNTDNVEFWRMIRPSAIFDEPGAFSFFIIFVIIINLLLNQNSVNLNKNNLFFLYAGLITFSITHFIMLLFYLIFKNKKSIWKISTILLTFFLIIALVLFTLDQDSILFQNFFSRFTLVDDGSFSGDNRSSQVKNFFYLLDFDISVLGANEKFKNYPYLITEVDQSANPFSIWFNYGFLAWVPYLIILVALGYKIINPSTSENIKFSCILLILLLLQRPYIFSAMWGMAVTFILLLIYKPSIHQKLNKNLHI